MGGGSLRGVARVAPRCTWQKPPLGSGPRTVRVVRGLGPDSSGFTTPGPVGRPTPANWVSVCLLEPRWKQEGGQEESQLWPQGKLWADW